MKSPYFVRETDSSNYLLKKLIGLEVLPEFFAVRTAFQTAGKGQAGNSWESAAGQNLLCSILLYPHNIPLDKHFVLSQIVSLAVVELLQSKGVECKIKWPNDIYWNDKKIAGILIENSLRSNRIESSIVGIGLNVNQMNFESDAPNPVSLRQIIAKKWLVAQLLKELIDYIQMIYKWDIMQVQQVYIERMYRFGSIHLFKIPGGETFKARIAQVEPDGQLKLDLLNGQIAGYYFKEIEFVI